MPADYISPKTPVACANMPCAADGGQAPRNDCRMVWMKIPGTVNRYKAPAIPLCPACRKALKSQWKYAH